MQIVVEIEGWEKIDDLIEEFGGIKVGNEIKFRYSEDLVEELEKRGISFRVMSFL